MSPELKALYDEMIINLREGMSILKRVLEAEETRANALTNEELTEMIRANNNNSV